MKFLILNLFIITLGYFYFINSFLKILCIKSIRKFLLNYTKHFSQTQKVRVIGLSVIF